MRAEVPSHIWRPLVVLAATVLGSVLAGCPPDPPPPPPPLVWLPTVSEDTLVEVHRTTGAVRLGGVEGVIGDLAREGCGPFALALRPADDDGNAYHNVESPPLDQVWLTPLAVRVESESPVVVVYTLGAEDVERTVEATAQFSAGPEGFVDIDVTFDAVERETAMVRACIARLPGGHAVGGGERFDAVDLTGRVVPLAFRAPGQFASGTNEAHAPVPWIVSTDGWAALVETERVGAFDVGVTNPSVVEARFHGTELPLRVRTAATQSEGLLEQVAAHNRRMGLPPMPPRWALAPQQWRNEHEVTVENGVVTRSGQDRFFDDAATMRELGIPGSVMWIDAPWSTGYNTFSFNPLQFPNPPALFSEAERLGYRVVVWATEHINSSDDQDQQPGMPAFASRGLFHAFEEADLLVSTASGAPFEFTWPRGFGGFVDFSNPAGGAAWGDLMRPLLDAGVHGFKLDYGETMRADLLGLFSNDVPVFADGETTRVHHTRYSRLYHEAALSELDDAHGPSDRFVITRSGGIFDQKNGTAIWPGDLDNDFRRAGEFVGGEPTVGGLPAAIAGALSLSMSGYPLYGSDIGGYRGGAPTTEVLLRWAQFGALSTIMQLGGGGTGDTTHNPWDPIYDTDVAIPVYRRYARLHMDLIPYLEAVLHEATTSGRPPLIPLGVAAPFDERAWADVDAYLLGPNLLVAPVVTSTNQRRVVFPPGEWSGWWDRSLHDGGSSTVVSAPLETLPLFMKAGGMVPMGDPRLATVLAAADDDVVDPERYGEILFVRVVAGEDSALELPGGVSLTQHTEGQGTTVTMTAPSARRVVLEMVLRGDTTGPWPLAPIRTFEAGQIGLATYDDFINCGVPPCTFRDEANGRLWALLDGDEFEVTFGDVPSTSSVGN